MPPKQLALVLLAALPLSGCPDGSSSATGGGGAGEAPGAPQVLWRAKERRTGVDIMDSSACVPAVGAGIVFAQGAALTLDGRKAWDLASGGEQLSTAGGAACIAQETVFAPTERGLLAVEAASGKQRWLATIAGLRHAPLVVGDLCIAGTEGALHALGVPDGKERWKLELAGKLASTPAAADGVLYVKANRELQALGLADRTQRWAVPADESLEGPVLWEDLVIYSRSGPPDAGPLEYKTAIVAVDSQGREQWASPFSRQEAFLGWGPLAVAEGVVVVRIGNGHLHGLDARMGSRRWSYDGNKGVPRVRGVGVGAGRVATVTVERFDGTDLNPNFLDGRR